MVENGSSVAWSPYENEYHSNPHLHTHSLSWTTGIWAGLKHIQLPLDLGAWSSISSSPHSFIDLMEMLYNTHQHPNKHTSHPKHNIIHTTIQLNSSFSPGLYTYENTIYVQCAHVKGLLKLRLLSLFHALPGGVILVYVIQIQNWAI